MKDHTSNEPPSAERPSTLGRRKFVIAGLGMAAALLLPRAATAAAVS